MDQKKEGVVSMLKYAIRGTKNGRVGGWYYPTTKRRVWPRIKHELEKLEQVYVKVSYGPGLYNDGTFSSMARAREFVNAATEKELLEYTDSW